MLTREEEDRIALLQGTVDLLILKVVALEPMHGWAIAQRIHELSDDVLTVEEGSLYPALYRMEERGWIDSEWGQSENNRRARFYRLTRAGRRQLEKELAEWERLSAAVEQRPQRGRREVPVGIRVGRVLGQVGHGAPGARGPAPGHRSTGGAALSICGAHCIRATRWVGRGSGCRR